MDSQTALLVFAILASAFFGAAINEAMWRWYEWRKTRRRVGIDPLPVSKAVPSQAQVSALMKSQAQLISLLTPSLSLPLMEMNGEQLKALRLSFGLDEYASPEQEPVDAQAAIDAAEEAFADPAKKGMI